MKPTIATLLTALSFLTLPTILAQGPLTPPGAPAPTMKTLDEIQPRKLINSLPQTIDVPGSYVFTSNLHFTAATGHAITITVSDVTIDLNGFTLSSTAAVTGDAIRIEGSQRNIAVKNGVITGTTTVVLSGTPSNRTWTTTPGGFATGINCPASSEPRSCQFSQLRIARTRSGALDAGIAAVVEHVTVTENGAFGIDAVDGTVSSSTAYINSGFGIGGPAATVSNSSALQNREVGITGHSVANCAATDNGDHGIHVASGTVANSRANSNAGTGINTSAGSVMNCVASGNGDHGIAGPQGVVAFSRALGNNHNSNGSQDIFADGATRTGNNPSP